MSSKKKRMAIFVSGSGTNMENIGKRVKSGELSCEIALVVCDKPGAKAIERAKNLGLEVFLVERKKFSSKEGFEAAINVELKRKQVDFICLAGYMKIVGPELVRAWQWKMINVHPSLLPKFPGAHSIKDAFDAKEKETGVTVHFVIAEVDAGPIILQKTVSIETNDTFETLEARVHATEYELYPAAIKLVLEEKVKIKGNQVEIVG